MFRKIALFLGITLVVVAVAGVSHHYRSRSAGGPAVAAVPLAERETWCVYRIRGARVGYGRTTVHNETEEGQPVVKVDMLFRLGTSRFDQPAQHEVHFTDTETPAGVLLASECEECENRKGSPQVVVKSTCRVHDGHLEVDLTSRGQRQTQSIAWSAENAGRWGPEDSLLRRPMQAGEHRVIDHLSPENQVVETDMTAREVEDVALLAGSFRLLRIDTIERFPSGQNIKGAIWADPSGEIFKEWLEPLQLECFRVPQEVAMANTPLAKFDLGLDTLVKLDKPLPKGHDTTQARYIVQINNGNPAAVFVASASQRVRWNSPHTAEITVYAIRPGSEGGNPDAAADPPTEADRQPNNFIQSEDAKIVADARKGAGDETDPWQVAVALERYVHDALTRKDLAQAFVTAADVASSHEGDCKAHALYLAALARARGIPARVAVGLVYMPKAQAFAYHMWTEVYIANRWIPIDGTLAKGGIGAGHLELGHSNMAGVAAYASFLPVIQVIGQLQVALLPDK